MCGRTRCALAPERVEALTGVPPERWTDRDSYRPSHNVSPGGWTPILRMDDHQQRPMLQSMRWGLVPSFTKPGAPLDFFKMFNARSETVAEKPAFSRLLSTQRCVVLLEGFYEWKEGAGGKKQPYFISFGEGSVIRMAGLYDVCWQPTGEDGGEEGTPLATYTILTCDSSARLAWLHNRMPVVLQDDAAVAAWLGGKQAPLHLCGPCNSEALVHWPVTQAMSRPDYDRPDASQDMRKRKGAITSFFKPSGSSPAKQAKQAKQQQQQQQQQQSQQQQQPKGSLPPEQASKQQEQQQQQQLSKGEQQQSQQQQQHEQQQQQPKGSLPPEQVSKQQEQQQQQLSKGQQQQSQQQQQHEQQQQQQQQKEEKAGQAVGDEARNPDEQQGPSAADNAVAAAAAAPAGARKRPAAEAPQGAPDGGGDAPAASPLKKAHV